MKTLTAIYCSLLLLSATLVRAHAQPFRTNTNPALLYYQAFLVAPAPLPQAEWDYLGSREGRTQPLPDRFGSILAGYNDQLALVRQAARATAPCEWGADLSMGMDTLLPYLAPAKAVAVTTGLRVTWDLQHNRQGDARDDLLASFTLARNVSRGGLLISMLVEGALESILCYNVAENFGRFSPETLQQLLAGLDALPPRGTVADCVEPEKAFSEAWLVNKVQELQKANSGDEAKVMAGVHELFVHVFDLRERAGMSFYGNTLAANWWEQLSQAAGGTSGGLTNLLRDVDPFSRKLTAILRLPYADYLEQMKQLKAEVQQSPNPLVPLLFFPVWESARVKEFKGTVFLAMVRAAMEYKLHGEGGLNSVTDPCGQGPFAFRRFVLNGVDRGFELKAADATDSFPQVLIFVEKDGPAFFGSGPKAGQAR